MKLLELALLFPITIFDLLGFGHLETWSSSGIHHLSGIRENTDNPFKEAPRGKIKKQTKNKQTSDYQISIAIRKKLMTYMIPVLLGTMWQLLPPLNQKHASIADVSNTIFRQTVTK